MSSNDAVEPSSNISSVINLLPKKYNAGKLEKLISLYVVGKIAYDSGKKRWDKWQANSKFIVSVPGDDDLYPLIHEWIIDQVPNADRHALIARVNKRGHNSDSDMVAPASDNQKRSTPKLRLLYDSNQVQILSVNGSSIEVSLVTPDWVRNVDVERSTYLATMAKREERIIFTAKTSYDQEKVIEFLKERATYLVEERKPQLYICSKWGGWSRRNDLPVRSLNSVVLRKGQKESLVSDLEIFFSHEKTYNDLGVPWHRGYLFYGPPGTGKTSLARALGEHFGLDTYYIPLSDLQEDGNLIQAIADVPARSILLLEDIDSVKAATNADGEQSGISIGGLLNALDGVITPHGLVTIMTTNHIDDLDPRLIRAGRADRHEQFDSLSYEQLVSLMSQFVNFDLDSERNFSAKNIQNVCPSDVIGIIKSNLNDRDKIVSEIRKLVSTG